MIFAVVCAWLSVQVGGLGSLARIGQASQVQG